MERINTDMMPLYFAGPVSWYLENFQKQEILLRNDARFPKQTYRHKCDLVTIEGVQTFSIPLIKHTRLLAYRSVEISYQEHWQNQLINALKTSYGKSPFFEYYDYRFEQIILEKHQYLWDLNYKLLELTLQCLKMDVKLAIANPDKYVPDPVPEPFAQPYYQVFADKTGFIKDASILDLIFNEGSDAWAVLNLNCSKD